MNRHFKLNLTSIFVNKPVGDGISSRNPDDMCLCGIGINKNGSRYNFAPIYLLNNSKRNKTFEFIPPHVLFDIEIPYKETDFLFCFWFYEKDNQSLKNNWQEVITNFNYLFDNKIQELRSFNYPRSEEAFQAFAEILISQNERVKRTADKKYLGWGDGDDVFEPFLIRTSHLGGSPSHVDTQSIKREYNGIAEGTGQFDTNYILHFNYVYSKVENVVTH